MEEGGLRIEDGLLELVSGVFLKFSVENLLTLDSGVPNFKYGESEEQVSESLACSIVGIAIILLRLHEGGLLLELQLLF